MRAVARQREMLLSEQASWVQRMQKALVQMNIQLTRGAQRHHGHDRPSHHACHCGRRARPRVAGPASPAAASRPAMPRSHRALHGQLARGASVRARASAGDVRRHWRATWTSATPSLKRCWPSACERQVDIGKCPRAGSKARVELRHAPGAGNWAGVDLTRINGLGVTVGDEVALVRSGRTSAALPASNTSAPGWACARAPRSAAARCCPRGPSARPTAPGRP